ncbi:hypothetical protein L1047_08550 [Synechococcus sp. Nb3U1]|uniref:hypothetical protein n=1 Tax=Synechococcus sp. Nb3U1 TaxID=1914529 RepID=UPI001F171D3F|nr:hypothetical protein [Synechococcus sp. Nb3U1]MCF2971242.1 hypothetical protein [Synechococcus sp. Nb3U1]
MGSRTKFFGTVLAMLAVNSIYMQLQQLSMTLQRDPAPSEQSSPEPNSTSERFDPLRRITQVLQVLRFADVSFVGILPRESTSPLEP